MGEMSKITDAAKGLDSILKSFRDTLKGNDKQVKTIVETLEDASDAREVENKKLLENTSLIMRSVGALAGLNVAIDALKKYTLDYYDAVERTGRGTIRNIKSVDEFNAHNKKSLDLTIKVQSALGTTVEDSAALATSLSNTIRQASNIDVSSELNAIGKDKFLALTSIYSKMSNLSVQEVSEMHRNLTLGLKMTSDEFVGQLDGMSKFGIQGAKTMELVFQNMDTAKALEDKHRKKYLEQLQLTAAVQERSAVNFGKYTDSLTKSRGVTAMKQAGTLAALSGKSMEEVAQIMVKARGKDPKAEAELTKLLSQVSQKTFGVDYAAERSKQMVGDGGTAKGALNLLELESGFSKVADLLGSNVDTMGDAKQATIRASDEVIEKIKQEGIVRDNIRNKMLEAQAAWEIREKSFNWWDKMVTTFTDSPIENFNQAMANSVEIGNKQDAFVAGNLTGLHGFREGISKLDHTLSTTNTLLIAISGLMAVGKLLGGGKLIKSIATKVGGGSAAIKSAEALSAASKVKAWEASQGIKKAPKGFLSKTLTRGKDAVSGAKNIATSKLGGVKNFASKGFSGAKNLATKIPGMSKLGGLSKLVPKGALAKGAVGLGMRGGGMMMGAMSNPWVMATMVLYEVEEKAKKDIIGVMKGLDDAEMEYSKVQNDIVRANLEAGKKVPNSIKKIDAQSIALVEEVKDASTIWGMVRGVVEGAKDKILKPFEEMGGLSIDTSDVEVFRGEARINKVIKTKKSLEDSLNKEKDKLKSEKDSRLERSIKKQAIEANGEGYQRKSDKEHEKYEKALKTIQEKRNRAMDWKKRMGKKLSEKDAKKGLSLESKTNASLITDIGTEGKQVGTPTKNIPQVPSSRNQAPDDKARTEFSSVTQDQRDAKESLLVLRAIKDTLQDMMDAGILAGGSSASNV